MTYLVALLVFGWIYTVVYVGLFSVLLLILIPRVPHLEWLGLVGIALFILASYRAKLAADAYARGGTGLLEAHTIAGAQLRANLSFLPVIGRFFGGDD